MLLDSARRVASSSGVKRSVRGFDGVGEEGGDVVWVVVVGLGCSAVICCAGAVGVAPAMFRCASDSWIVEGGLGSLSSNEWKDSVSESESWYLDIILLFLCLKICTSLRSLSSYT